VQDPVRQSALDLSTKLLTLPTATTIHTQSKAVLSSLFTSRAAFHWHKVSLPVFCRKVVGVILSVVTVATVNAQNAHTVSVSHR